MAVATLEENVVYRRPQSLTDTPTHYCPGCTHGIAHRLVAEVLDELGVRERTIGVSPVGCAVFAYKYFNVDNVVAAHGRAPAMATGIKRVMPDRVVFTYQGDGDLAAIGLAEIVHAATRGENFTTIFINNAIYGMTGGQMAPTSLPGQHTSSSPGGRDVEMAGFPVKMAELIAEQLNGLGIAMVELLSSCPTNWHMTPPEALEWIERAMIPAFPLGDYKVIEPVQAFLKR